MSSEPVATRSLARGVFGATFQNPVLLASGTCGFGLEVADVIDLEALGGIVTKSVTVEPRSGNPAPRLSEYQAGMINSVGLANPGLETVRREKLPWLSRHLARAQVFVSVAGRTVREYERVVAELDAEEGFLGFELNLSCPNDLSLNGKPFALDPEALAATVGACRQRTSRPVLVKLAPNDPDLEMSIGTGESAGADGFTLVNTLPGLILASETGAPSLGAGGGGVSGPALRPAGVRAVALASQVSRLPVVGVGGIGCGDDALEYLRAGAALIQVGTASFASPRAAERIVASLAARGLPARSASGPAKPTRRETAPARIPRGEDTAVPTLEDAPWPK